MDARQARGRYEEVPAPAAPTRVVFAQPRGPPKPSKPKPKKTTAGGRPALGAAPRAKRPSGAKKWTKASAKPAAPPRGGYVRVKMTDNTRLGRGLERAGLKKKPTAQEAYVAASAAVARTHRVSQVRGRAVPKAVPAPELQAAPAGLLRVLRVRLLPADPRVGLARGRVQPRADAPVRHLLHGREPGGGRGDHVPGRAAQALPALVPAVAALRVRDVLRAAPGGAGGRPHAPGPQARVRAAGRGDPGGGVVVGELRTFFFAARAWRRRRGPHPHPPPPARYRSGGGCSSGSCGGRCACRARRCWTPSSGRCRATE